MKAPTTAVLILLMSASTASAQKRAFGIEDFYRVRSVGELDVSRDGRFAAYTVTASDLSRAKRTTRVWLADLTTGESRQLTSGDNDAAPKFSPDGKALAFVKTADGATNLYLLRLDGGEAVALTRLSTGVSDPVWSPDGKHIAFSSDVYPECGADDACNKKVADTWQKGPLKAHMADALLFRHWTTHKDGTRTHVMLVDVMAGGGGAVRDVTPGQWDAPTFQFGGPVQYFLTIQTAGFSGKPPYFGFLRLDTDQTGAYTRRVVDAHDGRPPACAPAHRKDKRGSDARTCEDSGVAGVGDSDSNRGARAGGHRGNGTRHLGCDSPRRDGRSVESGSD